MMELSVLRETVAEMISSLRVSHRCALLPTEIDAAGRATLADALAVSLAQTGRQVIRGSIDGFHIPRSVRYRRGKDSPGGYYYDSFNHRAIIDCLLDPLGRSGDRIYRTTVFNHVTDQDEIAEGRKASETAILIFHGVFLMRPELSPYWDFRVFGDVSFETGLKRAVSRDSTRMDGKAEARRRYETRYYPGQRIYMRECDPISRADVVVGNEDPANPTLRTQPRPQAVESHD